MLSSNTVSRLRVAFIHYYEFCNILHTAELLCHLLQGCKAKLNVVVNILFEYSRHFSVIERIDIINRYSRSLFGWFTLLRDRGTTQAAIQVYAVNLIDLS